MKTLFTATHSNAVSSAQPCQFGVPFEQGKLTAPNLLEIVNEHGAPLEFHGEITMRWPDDSIRWLLIRTQTHAAYQFNICTAANPKAQTSMREESHVAPFAFNSEQVSYNSQAQQLLLGGKANIALVLAGNNQTLNQTITSSSVRHLGSLVSVLEVHSEASDLGVNLHQVYEFWHQQGIIKTEVGIHNPHRARHKGGLWDLGDEGSRYFEALTLVVNEKSNQGSAATLKVDNQSEWLQGYEVSVYQASSGGDNWNHINHVNHENRVVLPFKGYELTIAHSEAQNESGKARTKNQIAGRASPIAKLGEFSIRQENFWQNFPSKLTATSQQLTLDLFPKVNDAHELQGGERKYQTVFISTTGDDLSWAEKPAAVVLPSEYYETTKALPWFSAKPQDPRWRALIDQGINGDSNFFAKREVIDEYGWRNFGELYADHETLYQAEGEAPLVSHYNNQYDPIYGFVRQFALTGDTRWFELMDDLAKHVVDIDIYHTQEDRAEYNNGLFWHTDHYLPAHTVTHRTFSKHNDTSSTPGQTGGGPAAEHCYSMGLMYHYLLTGSAKSQASVLALADWMTNAHDDTAGFLQALLSVKKKELAKFKQLKQGNQVFAYRYPFTRGTGNYINTLLDAYLLDPKPERVEYIQQVLRQTLSPVDNIELRNLKDVEVGWHYLVLLAACIRLVETLNGKHVELTAYASACIKHYGIWMVENERPFLSDTSLLEFPNDTWVAQDIRKAFVFSYLNKSKLIENSRDNEFLNYVFDHLNQSATKNFSRILVLLLQNHFSEEVWMLSCQNDPLVSSHTQYASNIKLILGSMQKLLAGLFRTSYANEKKWIEARKK